MTRPLGGNPLSPLLTVLAVPASASGPGCTAGSVRRAEKPEQGWNEIVVDRGGNIDVNGMGFRFGAEEFRPYLTGRAVGRHQRDDPRKTMARHPSRAHHATRPHPGHPPTHADLRCCGSYSVPYASAASDAMKERASAPVFRA